MRAVLMVGGRGMRLRPFTTTIPKPLVPVGGELPIIELLLRQLRRCGVTEVTLATGHMGGLIQRYVGDGAQWDLTIDYWHEDAPLGTIGPLLQHRDSLPDDVLLLNGDLLCSLAPAGRAASPPRGGGGPPGGGPPRRIDVEFGVLEVVGTELNEFREKPQLAYLANMGIYVLSRTVLDQLDGDGAHGVDELIRSLLAAGVHPNVYEFDGYWLDIGRPEDYDRANLEFAELRRQLLGDEAGESDSTIDLRPLRPDPHPDPVPVDAIVGSVA